MVTSIPTQRLGLIRGSHSLRTQLRNRERNSRKGKWSLAIYQDSGRIDDWVRRWAGADAYGSDAMAAVTLAKG
jgi:hypothetical protein